MNTFLKSRHNNLKKKKILRLFQYLNVIASTYRDL